MDPKPQNEPTLTPYSNPDQQGQRIDLGPCEIVGVFGPVASGKTHLIKMWIAELDRFVAFDAVGELDAECDLILTAKPKQLWQEVKASPWYFRICYVPSDIQFDFVAVRDILWWTPSDKWLVIDECHFVFPLSMPQKGPEEKTLRLARKVKLGIIGASQRIADVSKLFTSSCRMIVLFWTQEARDLDAIADRWGDNTTEMVKNLRPLIYDDVTETVKQTPQCVVIRRSRQAKIVDL